MPTVNTTAYGAQLRGGGHRRRETHAAREEGQAEQIILNLREVEIDVGRGTTVTEAVKKIGVSEQAYCRWEISWGFRIVQTKRLKKAEKENSRLKLLVADAKWDQAMLQEVASHTCVPGEAVASGRHVRNQFGHEALNEYRAWRLIGQSWNTAGISIHDWPPQYDCVFLRKADRACA